MMRPRCAPLLLLLAVFQGACGSPEGKALCEAAFTRDLEAVEALIAQGADVNETVRFQGSQTKPVRIALGSAHMGDRGEAIALAVIEAGGDPNLSWSFGGSSEGGRSSTMYALAVVARGGSVKVVDALLKAGATVEGDQGGEALIAAARTNHVEILRLLADAGAPVNYMDDLADTPLGAAVEAGAREAIAFLEERGAREW